MLPAELLFTESIERQVIGVAAHSRRLLVQRPASQARRAAVRRARHTGKTHTVRYLLGLLPEMTVIVISGRALSRIREACSVARTLQPAIVVVEDVDLIAEERTARPGEHPLLFQLLNEMEGLNSADDVTVPCSPPPGPTCFNPPWPPGGGGSTWPPSCRCQTRTRGAHCSASTRRAWCLTVSTSTKGSSSETEEGRPRRFCASCCATAALLAAEARPDQAASVAGTGEADGSDGAIRVTGAQLTAALDQLLGSRAQLTRVLLGGQSK